jgi:hypothetical protein
MNRTASFVESAPNPVFGHAGARGAAGGAAAPAAPAAANPLGLLGELRAVTAARSAARRAAARAGASGEFFLELDKPATAGVPVREMMTQIFMHQRSRAAKEFLLYFLYVLVFAAVVLQINPSSVRGAGERAGGGKRKAPFSAQREEVATASAALTPTNALARHHPSTRARRLLTKPTRRCTMRSWTRSSRRLTRTSRRRSPTLVSARAGSPPRRCGGRTRHRAARAGGPRDPPHSSTV